MFDDMAALRPTVAPAILSDGSGAWLKVFPGGAAEPALPLGPAREQWACSTLQSWIRLPRLLASQRGDDGSYRFTLSAVAGLPLHELLQQLAAAERRRLLSRAGAEVRSMHEIPVTTTTEGPRLPSPSQRLERAACDLFRLGQIDAVALRASQAKCGALGRW